MVLRPQPAPASVIASRWGERVVYFISPMTCIGEVAGAQQLTEGPTCVIPLAANALPR